MIFWLVLKLEISYNRVIIISWRILVSFYERIFGRLYFNMVKYLSFHNSSFCLNKIILFNVNGKARLWHMERTWNFVFGSVCKDGCGGPKRVFFFSLAWVSWPHAQNTRGKLLFWFSWQSGCGGAKKIFFFWFTYMGAQHVQKDSKFFLDF